MLVSWGGNGTDMESWSDLKESKVMTKVVEQKMVCSVCRARETRHKEVTPGGQKEWCWLCGVFFWPGYRGRRGECLIFVLSPLEPTQRNIGSQLKIL